MEFDKAKQEVFLAEHAKEALPELAEQAYEAVVGLKSATQLSPATLLTAREWVAIEASGFCLMHAFDEGYKHGLHVPQEPWLNFVSGDGTDKTARLIANVNSAIDEHLRLVSQLEELRGQLSRAVLDIKDALDVIRAANKENAND